MNDDTPPPPPRLSIAARSELLAKNTQNSPIQRMERDALLRQIVIAKGAGELTTHDLAFLPGVTAQLQAGVNLSAADGYRLDRMLNKHTVRRSG